MSVYIYSGYGASIKNADILFQMFSMALFAFKIPVKRINESDLNDPNAAWKQDGEVLVFGGGEFTRVKEKLKPEGYQAIKDFAARKAYLGICMGGYAGATHIDFLGQDVSKTSAGFGFFNHKARGSWPIAPVLYTGKSDSARIAVFHHEKHKRDFPALYWGGPSFEINEESNIETLITLKEPYSDKKLAMGIKVPVGENGKAILLGYHSEAALPEMLREWVLKFTEDANDITRIEAEMAPFAKWQFLFGWAAMLDDLNLVPGHSFVDQILHPHSYDPRTGRKVEKSLTHLDLV